MSLALAARFPAAGRPHANACGHRHPSLFCFRRTRRPAGAQFEGSNEVGVFSRLTNSYALVCNGGAANFYSVFEAELAEHIPVVRCTIAGCRFVGRVTAGEWDAPPRMPGPFAGLAKRGAAAGETSAIAVPQR